MSRLLVILLPLVGGALIAAQAPVNARLRTVLESPIGSAAISFTIGTALLLGALVAVGQAGNLKEIGGGPWWAYLGGAFGAVFVVATLVAAPRVGVVATFVAVVLGQVAMASAIDRFGWFGLEQRELTASRIAAIILLLASLALLARPR